MASIGGLTARAQCVLATGVAAVSAGELLGESGLVRGGILAIALPLLALVFTYRARVRIAARRTLAPARVSAGGAVSVRITLQNTSRIPASTLMLEDELPAAGARGGLSGTSGTDRNGSGGGGERARFTVAPLGGHEQRTVSYRLPATARGHHRVGPLRARLVDPFGMVDVLRSYAATSEFWVGPVIEPLGISQAPRAQGDGENTGSHSVGAHGADDASTREYRTGDDLRKIHWRSTARRGALTVRQEERPWAGRAAVLLDLRAVAHAAAAPELATEWAPEPAAEETWQETQRETQETPWVAEPAAPELDPRTWDSAEWAISAAASVATHLLGHHQDVHLLMDPSAALPVTHATVVRDVLALAQPLDAESLTPLAAALSRLAREAAVFAVLGTPDAATLTLLCGMFAHRGGTGLGTSAGGGTASAGGNAGGSAGGSSWGKALLLDVGTWAGQAPQDEDGPVYAAARQLRACGWQVAVVRAGQTVASAWNGLLERPVAGARAGGALGTADTGMSTGTATASPFGAAVTR